MPANQKMRPKPSIFMAKPKKTMPAKTVVGAALQQANRAASGLEVEIREQPVDAALDASELFLKEHLECAQSRKMKLAPTTATAPTFDDRKEFAPKEADFDVPPLLQVGDFNEWWKKAEMMLISQGHFTLSLEEADSSADTAFYTNGREPARLLKRYIGKDVLGRVPVDALDHIQSLIPVLRKVASKPFRLLDLPAELRVRILELVVEKRHPIYLHAEAPKAGSTVAYKGGQDYQPAIARASRQLRKESMPIFLKNNEFRSIRNYTESAYPRALYDWSMANMQWLSSLRRLTLQYRLIAEDGNVSVLQLPFRYTPGQGLQVDEAKLNIPDGFLEEVRDRITRINTYGAANGLEGQMVTMFEQEPGNFNQYVPDVAQGKGVGGIEAMEM